MVVKWESSRERTHDSVAAHVHSSAVVVSFHFKFLMFIYFYNTYIFNTYVQYIYRCFALCAFFYFFFFFFIHSVPDYTFAHCCMCVSYRRLLELVYDDHYIFVPCLSVRPSVRLFASLYVCVCVCLSVWIHEFVIWFINESSISYVCLTQNSYIVLIGSIVRAMPLLIGISIDLCQTLL